MHFFKIDKELAEILLMEVDTFVPKPDSAVVAYVSVLVSLDMLPQALIS